MNYEITECQKTDSFRLGQIEVENLFLKPVTYHIEQKKVISTLDMTAHNYRRQYVTHLKSGT